MYKRLSSDRRRFPKPGRKAVLYHSGRDVLHPTYFSAAPVRERSWTSRGALTAVGLDVRRNLPWQRVKFTIRASTGTWVPLVRNFRRGESMRHTQAFLRLQCGAPRRVYILILLSPTFCMCLLIYVHTNSRSARPTRPVFTTWPMFRGAKNLDKGEIRNKLR